jgi:signal transduction histidine kinase
VRIAQVISNLLNNAAKYTQTNGCIHLSAERKEQDVFIRIKDNGIGLSTDMLPRIFDMFSQVDSSIERAQGGMGW